VYDNEIVWPEVFREQMNLEHLQLSQHIFKRESILDFNFTADNNIHNDIRLVLHASTRATKVQMMRKILFYQTIDGGDNLSFPESNHSINTTQTLDFLEDYGLHPTTPHTTRP
jgi:hypothetical protein